MEWQVVHRQRSTIQLLRILRTCYPAASIFVCPVKPKTPITSLRFRPQ